MEVKDNNYYVVLGFMVKDLQLKGIERDVYAIIYGFSQADGRFTGSLQYLADWTCATKQGVLKALTKLLEKQLITKIEVVKNNIKFVEYQATEFNSIKKSLIPIKQSLTNNIVNNIDNNLLDKSTKLLSEKNTKKSEITDLGKIKNIKELNLGKTKRITQQEKLYHNLLDNILVKSKLYQNDTIRDLLVRWLNSLYELKKLPSSNSLEDSLLELEKYSINEIIDAINNSIKSGYPRFYPKHKENISSDGINRNSELTEYEKKKQEESEKWIDKNFS